MTTTRCSLIYIIVGHLTDGAAGTARENHGVLRWEHGGVVPPHTNYAGLQRNIRPVHYQRLRGPDL
jgi:hypothetical protein